MEPQVVLGFFNSTLQAAQQPQSKPLLGEYGALLAALLHFYLALLGGAK